MLFSVYWSQPHHGSAFSVYPLYLIFQFFYLFKVFEVVPYLRIIEPEIQLKDRVVTAKFKLEQVTSNKVYRVSLFAYSHIDVSSKLNLVNKTIELNRAIADGEEFQLSINLDEYSSTLLSGKSYYFRIGAQSQGSETKYNYATAVKLNL